MLADAVILNKMGQRLKSIRLKQNITQQSLAEATEVSLSTIKKMESGEIRSFDSLLRVLRTLGKLDVLQPLIEEESLSPSEYYALVHSKGKAVRKRAAGKIDRMDKEDSEW